MLTKFHLNHFLDSSFYILYKQVLQGMHKYCGSSTVNGVHPFKQTTPVTQIDLILLFWYFI